MRENNKPIKPSRFKENVSENGKPFPNRQSQADSGTASLKIPNGTIIAPEFASSCQHLAEQHLLESPLRRNKGFSVIAVGGLKKFFRQ